VDGNASGESFAVQSTRIIAHRGVALDDPENSLAAFRRAAATTGLDGVEFDVHPTADGGLAVMHDARLERTTDGNGMVSEATLPELAGLRLRAHGGSGEQRYTEESVPSLAQVLDVLADSGLELHVELKNDDAGDPYPGLAEKVLIELGRHGLIERAVMTSFSPAVLEEVRYLDSHVRLLGSVDRHVIEALGGVKRALARFVAIENCTVALEKRVTRQLFRDLTDGRSPHRYGIWVLNSEEELREAGAAGYRQITTDRVDRALALRNEVRGDAKPSARAREGEHSTSSGLRA
jgi:glycerophosphoryl diester phosphodiesterase